MQSHLKSVTTAVQHSAKAASLSVNLMKHLKLNFSISFMVIVLEPIRFNSQS